MRTILAVALLTALAIAGCAGSAGPKDDDPLLPEDEFDDVESTETTGVILGLVLDEAVTPLEGATVRVTGAGTEEETTTSESGAFAFEGLVPGSYFVVASLNGFGPIQQQVNVVAGVDDPDLTRIMLTRIPGMEADFQVLHFQGFLECSFIAVLYFVPCENFLTGEEIGNDNYYNSWTLDRNVSYMHVVLDWDATQPFGTELYFNILDNYNEYNVPIYAGGPAPLVGNAGGDALAPLNEQGSFAIEVAGNGEGGTGVGVSVQQDFDAYIVLFYNYEPPADYNYLTDGDPEIPR